MQKTVARDLERQYNSLHVTCFRDYVRRIEDNIKYNPKPFWSYINSRKNVKGIPQNVRYNGEFAGNTNEAVNLFSLFFQSVLSNNSPPLLESYLDGLPHYNLNIPRLVFSQQQVQAKLLTIDAAKGAGPDRLPPFFIKNCAASLALPISSIFNRSLGDGVFPSVWKVAAVTSIHKNGSVHDVPNYRGISILGCLPKILESMVHGTLYDTIHHIIAEEQYGFVRKRSTTTNLMCYVSILVEKFEKRQQVDSI